MAIVVTGRGEEGERRRAGGGKKEKERKRGPTVGVREHEAARRNETRKADDGYDGDGQWLYTG